MEESESTIQIPFSLTGPSSLTGPDNSHWERFPFWSQPTTIEWFRKRGYTLYTCLEAGVYKPSVPNESGCEAKYPYASYDTECNDWKGKENPLKVPLLGEDGTGKIVYAQDSSNRHVVIKVVLADSNEYRILDFLRKLNPLEENGVVPVLDLLPNGECCFAVMPRWGADILSPTFTQLYEVIDLIHWMLKGLTSLHENNICHGDISTSNTLVNHFTNTRYIDSNETRQERRLNRQLAYALVDFDHAYIFPTTSNRNDCRLPYHLSWGTFNLTNDTGTGEYEYNPFVFDVGMMGVRFCDQFQHLTVSCPALAPLFDMMTTWDVERRFTAPQALEFFETHLTELTASQLRTYIPQQNSSDLLYHEYDRWQHLPDEFVEKWAMYRAPPEPRMRKWLRAICARPYWCHIVPRTRWFCFRVFSKIPRRCYRWLFSSILHK